MRRLATVLPVLLLSLVGSCTKEPSTGQHDALAPYFDDVAAQRGLDRLLRSGGPDKLTILENVGTGVALLDTNGDGRLDVYLANAGSVKDGRILPGPGAALYLQTESGQFVDRTTAAGLEFRGWGTGVAVGDIDGDGDPDLFLACFGRNRLYENRGGHFVDISAKAGFQETSFSSSAAFLDYDGDGLLDLYVANYVAFDPTNPRHTEPCRESGVPVPCGPGFFEPAADHLYHNEGGGLFRERSREAGMADAEGAYGLGVAVGDLDGDGLADIYVANDTTANFLWKNRGDGSFEDIALFAGAALSGEGQGQAGMGVALGDANRDGKLDVFVTNYSQEYNALYVNAGDGTFDERASPSGLGGSRAFQALGWAALFVDVDSDGDEDLIAVGGHVYRRAAEVHPALSHDQPALLFLAGGASGAPRFELADAATAGALSVARAHRGAASGDIDRDGDVDLLLTVQDGPPVLLLNRRGEQQNSLFVRLVGRAPNREAVGALLHLRVGGRTLTRQVTRSGGYLSSSDIVVHFGLGAAPAADSLRVRWPSGQREHLDRLEAGNLYRITEGEGRAVVERRLGGP